MNLINMKFTLFWVGIVVSVSFNLVNGGNSFWKLKQERIPALNLKTEEFQQPNFRLPDSINPLHYFIRIQPFLNGNFSLHGYTEITFEVHKPTLEIILHMADIVALNETLKVSEEFDEAGREIQVVKQAYYPKQELLIISLRNEIKRGNKYVLKLNYIGLINDKLRGFYRSSYTDSVGQKRWIAVTHFQPTSARMAFPCFDEPAMKAEFSLEIIRESGLSSISNMPKLETVPEPGQNGWFIDRFERSVKMSTYLLAFVVSSFDHVKALTRKGTLVRVWSRSEAIHQSDYALKNGVQTLEFFENFFRIPYPLPKMDMIAAPDFAAGAMENWGLITYREIYLMFDENQSSLLNKNFIGYVIAHEQAHQWFGNLVTPYWWSDLWLNEGFATYMGMVGQNAIEPGFKVMERFVTVTLRNALISDSLDSSHPISVDVEHPDEIAEIFDAISYSKGASLIRMMSHFLTEDTFRKGVTNYLIKFAYSVARQDDLWHHITEQALIDKTLPLNITVKEIMDSWTLQKGYPVVSVAVREDGTAEIKQERFLISGKANFSDNSTYRWWIPITFTNECRSNFTNTLPASWMSPSEATKIVPGMPSENEWVIFNLLQTGFYRVNYERSNWRRLGRQLKRDHFGIHPINRAQIIGDAFQLAKSGLLNYDIPLDMISYLAQEREYVPLQSAVYESGYLTYILEYTNLYNDYKNYMLSLLTPHYDNIGFDDKFNDDFISQSKRSLVLHKVCYFGYEPCINRTKKLYDDWMNDPENDKIISPSVKNTVYCNAIREGSHREWQFASYKYVNTNTISEKRKLLSAMGCSRNATHKMILLKLAFTPGGEIRKQDSTSAFRALIRDRESSIMAWNYLKQNWQTIYDYLNNKGEMMVLINAATGHIRSYEELEERDAFIASKPILQETATRSLQQSREKIVSSINWLNVNMEAITQWFYNNGYRKHTEPIVSDTLK